MILGRVSMRYYRNLVEMPCFSSQDLTSLIGSYDSARAILHRYMKAGLIERVKHNLYAVISLETGQPIANRFAIGTRAAEGAYISHHSALEYHGFANQVFKEVYVTSPTRFRTFEYGGLRYIGIIPRINSGVEKRIGAVRVTSLERTVIDSINDIDKIGGLEELLKCLALIPSLKEDKLVACMEDYGKGFLYQKTGYLLSFFKEEWRLRSEFFQLCRERISSTRKYLDHTSPFGLNNALHYEWGLIAPKNPLAIIGKGVD